MASVRYKTNPDGRVDVDYGSSPVASSKKASVLAPEFAADRQETREGYGGLDEMVSQDGRPHPSQDRDLAVPQERVAPLGHPRKARNLQEGDVTRAPLSSRQRKDRSRVKNRVQDELATTQVREVAHLIESPQRWTQVNDALSAQAGDAQQLPELQLRQIQRVDRAVQAYEKANDRSHVVYANCALPGYINSSNVEGYVRNHLGAGSVQTFDRFTGAAHCLHEIDLEPGRDTSRTIALEISTRRGMYLGRSDSADDTSHLLPRGIVLHVQGLQRAAYTRPDGSSGQRYVLQMSDTPPPPPKEEKS